MGNATSEPTCAIAAPTDPVAIPALAPTTSSNSDSNFCPICFEEFCYLEERGDDRKHYDHVTKCFTKPCDHALCIQCLLNLCQSRSNCRCQCRWKGPCPMCRGPVFLRTCVFAER